MKKIVIVFLAAMLMVPTGVYSKKYWRQRHANIEMPIRKQVMSDVSASIDEETGELFVVSNTNISNLNISLTSNGITYLNTTTSLDSGEFYSDSLDNLDEGTYILTLSTKDRVICQYEIIVEED